MKCKRQSATESLKFSSLTTTLKLVNDTKYGFSTFTVSYEYSQRTSTAKPAD